MCSSAWSSGRGGKGKWHPRIKKERLGEWPDAFTCDSQRDHRRENRAGTSEISSSQKRFKPFRLIPKLIACNSSDFHLFYFPLFSLIDATRSVYLIFIAFVTRALS